MRKTRVTFPSGQLLLEGEKSTPTGAGKFPAVVVCHPHPSFGGSMDNNVVKSICEALSKESIITLRFNFRGVGKSQGSFGHGMGEQEDVKAALSFLVSQEKVDPNRLGLAGYSAGAVFALPVAVSDDRVQALASISLPLEMADVEAIKAWPKPKLFVSGSKDDYTSAEELDQFCLSCVEPKDCQVVEGADHFWQGYEADLAMRVSQFFSRFIGGSKAP